MMRRILYIGICGLGLLFAAPAPALAQVAVCPGSSTKNAPAYAHEQLTVGASSTPLTSAVYLSSNKAPAMAEISIEGANIRYWVDGTAPTATVGMAADIPGGLSYTRIFMCGQANVQSFRAIAKSGSATLFVQYYSQ